MRWLCWIVLATFVVAGCKSSKGTAETTAEPGKTAVAQNPEQALYEQVRSGNYQINAALDAVETARTEIRPLLADAGGDAKDALQAVSEILDNTGSTLSDFSDAPPSFEEFKKDFASQDEDRIDSIDACSQALVRMREGEGIISDMADSAPASVKGKLDTLDDHLLDITDSLEEAIKAMGGKVPPDPDDEPEPSTPAKK